MMEEKKEDQVLTDEEVREVIDKLIKDGKLKRTVTREDINDPSWGKLQIRA